ncbi:MAG TPA: HD domain-containing phosphohydrolase [Anaerolineales bacterium]|nr:HD domain-containing phosphohydrolase [Anaerolineales bacterium]
MLPNFRGSSTEELSKQTDRALRISADIFALGKRWTRICVEMGGVSQACIAHVDEDNCVQWIGRWPLDPILHPFPAPVIEKAIHSGEPVTFQDHEELVAGGIFPLLGKGRVIGLIGLLSTQTDYFKARTIAWISALASTISDSFFQIQSHSAGQRLVEHSICQMLQSSLDVRDPLPAVLELISSVIQGDAMTVLSYKQPSQRYDLLATYKLDAQIIAKLKLYFETGLAGKAASERKAVWIEDLTDPGTGSRPISPLVQEGFRSYLALPLIGHNDFLGILEVAWRTPQDIQPSSVDFLERMAEYIAFTMERSAIVKDLRHRNKELASTYNAMIEGLSRALELRDLETEGHTRRVSILMMQFVEHMQIPPDQWDAIRQGALLHDIGKLGIPDAILLKPGSLTQQERQVMQQHAVYGYNVLAPIINLRQTLDIALYHHERWDGSGYPYGLKGEQIPLVARLFAVVDVFDALTSDRPYRSAWSHSQAIEYLKEQAGRQFDPRVVELFLEITKQ